MRSSVRAIAALTSVVAALAVLLLGHGTVSAHNTLLSSSPPDGSQLTESPTQIALQFDLPAPLETASAELIDATGVRTDLTDLFHGPAGETEIVAPLPAGLSGAVTVRWRLVGPDGHPLTGRVSFTVAMPTSTSPAAATSVPPVETSTTSPSLAASADDDSGDTTGTPGAVRWLLRFASYVAIGAVIGITLTDRLIWHGLASRPSFRRLISRSLAAVAALAFAQLLILGADIEGTSPWRAFGALDTATLTDAGVALSIRILLCAVAWVVLCEMDFVHAQVRWTALTLVGVALMGTWAWAGHARSQRWSWLGVPVDVVHHSAASLWVAALAIVGITALTALQPAELEPVMRRIDPDPPRGRRPDAAPRRRPRPLPDREAGAGRFHARPRQPPPHPARHHLPNRTAGRPPGHGAAPGHPHRVRTRRRRHRRDRGDGGEPAVERLGRRLHHDGVRADEQHRLLHRCRRELRVDGASHTIARLMGPTRVTLDGHGRAVAPGRSHGGPLVRWHDRVPIPVASSCGLARRRRR